MPTPKPVRWTIVFIFVTFVALSARDVLADEITAPATTVTAVSITSVARTVSMPVTGVVQVQIAITAPTEPAAIAAVPLASAPVQYKYRHLVLAAGGGFSAGMLVRPRSTNITAGIFGIEVQALAAYRISRNNGFGFGAQGLLRSGAGWRTEGIVFEGALLPAMYWHNHILAMGAITKMQAAIASGNHRWGSPKGPDTGGIISLTHLLPFGTKRIASMYLRFAGGGYSDASAFATASFGMSFGMH